MGKIHQSHAPKLTATRPDRGSALQMAGTAAALALITFAAYAGALSNGFVDWDDPAYVQNNPLLVHPTGANALHLLRAVVSANYHPLTMLSLWVNSALSGVTAARPYIVTNVVLHALATGLVFWFVHRLTNGRWLTACMTALLFGIHPLHVESVAWVSERKDVLYAACFVGACIAALRYLDRGGRRWLAAAWVLFVMACLAKAMAVVFPLVLLLLAYWRDPQRRGLRAAVSRIPAGAWAAFASVALLFGVIALDVQRGGDFFGLLTTLEHKQALGLAGHVTPLIRAEIVAYGFCMYLVKLALPLKLSAFYPYPSVAQIEGASRFVFLGAIAAAVGVVVLAAWAVRRQRPLFFGIAFYCVTVALVLQLVPVGQVIMADRYAYLSSIGPFFIAGCFVDALWRRGRAAGIVAVTLVAVFAAFCFARTGAQVRTWRDTESLWTPVIRLYPNAAPPYRMRGTWYANQGRADDAIRDLNTSLALDPHQAQAYSGLALAYGMKRELARVIEVLDRGLAIDSTRTNDWYNRGIANLELNPAEAVNDFGAALRHDPTSDPRLWSARGYACLRAGQWPQAVESFDRVVVAGAATANDYYYRGLAHFQLGDRVPAAADVREALRRDPSLPEARELLRRMNSGGS